MRRLAAAAALFFALFAAPSRAEDLYATIQKPVPGNPVFGSVEVAVHAGPAGAVETVELFVDGRFIQYLEAPDYKAEVDVGEENVEHRFEVIVRGAGEPGRALLMTPKVRVDEELELNLQQLYVTVTRDEQRVLDLGEGDLTVYDDGQEQTLVTFERGDVPLVAVLLVDASASMWGGRLDAALGGARAFVRGMKELDLAKVLLFSDRIVHTTPFTGFREILTAGLGDASAVGGTALNDHLYMALRLLEERQGRRVIVILSDGVDVASVLDMEDVLWVARRSQALVYWIRLGRPSYEAGYRTAWRDSQANRRELEALVEIVDSSGGKVESIVTVDESQAAFERILEELREQYVLGYYPSNAHGDGKWHEVEVRLRRPGLKVRTREGYLDD